MPPQPWQLEESNRTLTVDVANLAGEKEELNNQLKDVQQSASPNQIVIPRRVFLHKRLTGCVSIFTELQKAREAEKQMNSHKVSFERLLQNERTLKIQVCVWAPTHVWKVWHASFLFLLKLSSPVSVPLHHLGLRIYCS